MKGIVKNLDFHQSPLETAQKLYGLTHQVIKDEKARDAEEVQKLKKKWSTWHEMCVVIEHDPRFRGFVFGLIVMNALTLALEADRVLSKDAAQTSSHVFTTLFVIEMIIRLSGRRHPMIQEGMLIFDLVIVAAGIVDNWILLQIVEDEQSRSLAFISAFRIFRIFRVVRVFTVIRSIRPLRVLLDGIAQALRSLIWILCCILFWFTVFATIVAAILKNTAESDPMYEVIDQHFATVGQTFQTIFLSTLGGLDWGDRIIVPMVTASGKWIAVAVVFLTFSCFTILCIMNITAGIFIEQIVMSARNDDQQTERENLSRRDQAVQQLKTTLQDADAGDKKRVCTWNEISEVITRHPDLMTDVELDDKQASVLFQQLKTGEGVVHIDEFVFGVLKLHCSSKTVDMLAVDYQQKKTLQELESLTQSCSRKLNDMHSAVNKVSSSVETLSGNVFKVRADLEGIEGRLEVKLDHLKYREESGMTFFMKQAKQAEIDENIRERGKIEERLGALRRQVDAISNGSYATESELAISESRRRIRERLDQELRPWLRQNLFTGGTCQNQL